MTIGLVTLVLAPLGIVLAFFGMSAREVDPEASIFDLNRYWPLYLGLVLGVLILALAQTAFSYIERQRVQSLLLLREPAQRQDYGSS
jgi:hypothetical protein